MTTSKDGELRNPRVILTVNGTALDICSYEVHGSGFFIADNYNVHLPLYGQPEGFDWDFWMNAEEVLVKIYRGFPTDPDAYSIQDLDLIMVGESNQIEIDPIGGTISIDGRDLSSRLIDSKITQTFFNQTSSQLATQFANDNSLTPRVTQTNTLVGNFFQSENSLIGNNTTEWDLLVFLAQKEKFVVFVENETLVFEPRPDPKKAKNPYVLTYVPPSEDSASPSFDGVGLKIYKNTKMAGDIAVKVKVPYSPATGKTYSVRISSSNKTKKGIVSAKPKKFTYSVPGLSPEQASQKASDILDDLTNNGIRISTTLPPTSNLKKDTLVQIKGTNTAADNFYYVDLLTETYNFQTKEFSMDLIAKNKLPNQEHSND